MTVSNISSEATGPTVTKLYVEPSRAEGTNICLIRSRKHDQHGYHASRYSINIQFLFSGTNGLMVLKQDMWNQVLEKYQDWSLIDLGWHKSFIRQGQIWWNARTYDLMEGFENFYPITQECSNDDLELT